MKKSKAGKKLSPVIAKYTAPIYARNNERYSRLVLWVWHVQKRGWPDEAIANALRLGDRHMDTVDNWWTYLTFLLPKAKAAATEQESNDHKSADMALASEFVEFLKSRGAR